MSEPVRTRDLDVLVARRCRAEGEFADEQRDGEPDTRRAGRGRATSSQLRLVVEARRG